MKQSSTLILKTAISLIGLTVLGLCIFVIPQGIASDNMGGYRLILAGMLVPAIPFFAALYQGFKLLSYIDKQKAFSEQSVKALTNIKYCAFAISALYAVGMPYIYHVADKDDAPGVVALGLIIIGVSFIIATAAALFGQLLQNVIEIKSENDLTV